MKGFLLYLQLVSMHETVTALLEYLNLSTIFLWAYADPVFDYSIGVSSPLQCKIG